MAPCARVPLPTAVAGMICLSLSAAPADLCSQAIPPTLRQERGDLARWLAEAPLSPFAAVALHPIGPGLTIGAGQADVPLAEFGPGTVKEENGLAVLTLDDRRRALPRGRPVVVGPYTFLTAGARGRTTLAVFGAPRGVKHPAYFTYRGDLVASAQLEPPERSGPFAALGLDGLETQAVEAGFVRVAIEGQEARLRTYRMGESEDDEAALFVFFQDPTNGTSSYPGGRFVELIPQPGGGYQVDFNRARNPFCAYSTVFPCPAPWPGNRLSVPIPAGERYPATQEAR